MSCKTIQVRETEIRIPDKSGTIQSSRIVPYINSSSTQRSKERARSGESAENRNESYKTSAFPSSHLLLTPSGASRLIPEYHHDKQAQAKTWGHWRRHEQRAGKRVFLFSMPSRCNRFHASITTYPKIGTPLPPLEKSRDTGEFVPLWKQEVLSFYGVVAIRSYFLFRSGMRKAGVGYTVLSPEGFQLDTSILRGPRKVWATCIYSSPSI